MTIVVAIDGPAGSGKSTLGRGLASALDLPYVSTGSMYRALTAHVLDRGVDPADADEVVKVLEAMSFTLTSGSPAELSTGEVPMDITAPDVERHVSLVARHPNVRARMATLQRGLGRDGAVMEGRDIASVIFPDAALKVFLGATPQVRAARRIAERGADDADALSQDLERRDELDAKTNPPIPQEDAVMIDTSSLSADEVLDVVLGLARERMS